MSRATSGSWFSFVSPPYFVALSLVVVSACAYTRWQYYPSLDSDLFRAIDNAGLLVEYARTPADWLEWLTDPHAFSRDHPLMWLHGGEKSWRDIGRSAFVTVLAPFVAIFGCRPYLLTAVFSVVVATPAYALTSEFTGFGRTYLTLLPWVSLPLSALFCFSVSRSAVTLILLLAVAYATRDRRYWALGMSLSLLALIRPEVALLYIAVCCVLWSVRQLSSTPRNGSTRALSVGCVLVVAFSTIVFAEDIFEYWRNISLEYARLAGNTKLQLFSPDTLTPQTILRIVSRGFVVGLVPGVTTENFDALAIGLGVISALEIVVTVAVLYFARRKLNLPLLFFSVSYIIIIGSTVSTMGAVVLYRAAPLLALVIVHSSSLLVRVPHVGRNH